MPHTRSDTSQQKTSILFDPEKLVSKKGQKKKIFSTPDATLLAPGSSSHIFPSKEISQKLVFPEKEPLSSPIHFQEPILEELSFESVSFPFIESQPNSVTSSSAIVHIPLPISVVPPLLSPPTTGIHFTPTQGAVNQGINMAAPAFLSISSQSLDLLVKMK